MGREGSGWLANQVASGKEWDYKKDDYAKEDFGNFNYGATGRVLGFDREFLRWAAGVFQKDSEPEWGSMFDNLEDNPNTLFGDDPRDQEMIIQGMDYYDNYYEPKYGKN